MESNGTNLVSIVMPTYNAENTITESVDSIKMQEYQNWELIIVDDGSTDTTGLLADSFARLDNRIHVIHTENQGIDRALNTGLGYITGKWLTFLNSDDLFTKDALLNLVNEAEDYDMTVGGIEYFGAMDKKFAHSNYYLKSKEEIRKNFSNMFKEGAFWNAARTLYRADRIHTKFHLTEEKRLDLDSLFFATSLSNASSVRVIPHIVYMFRTGNKNALSHVPLVYKPSLVGLTCNKFLECSEKTQEDIDLIDAYYIHYFIKYLKQAFNSVSDISEQEKIVKEALDDEYLKHLQMKVYPISEKERSLYIAIMTKDFELIRKAFTKAKSN